MKSLAKSFKIPKRISSYSSQFSPKNILSTSWLAVIFEDVFPSPLRTSATMSRHGWVSNLKAGWRSCCRNKWNRSFQRFTRGTPLKCIAYMYVIEYIYIYIYVLMMDEILVNNDVTICLVINCNLCRISTMSIQSQRQHERQRGEEKFSFYRSLERLRR